MHRGILIIASLLSALAVALGAFGAHGLEVLLPAEEVRGYRTGIQYHFYHAFALFLAGSFWRKIPVSAVLWSSRFFTTGILLFSGSLYIITYLKTTGYTLPRWFFLLTPFGGVCFILGWFVLGWGINKGKGKEWTKQA